ncbi:MAG: hypothetical protein AAF989_17070, partial [Planctomycetota bacterium]
MVHQHLVHWRHVLFLAGIALFALAWGPSRRLALDRQITSMFSEDDPVRTSYQRLQEDFGGNVV